MTSLKDAQQVLGELFIMGFSGLELSDTTSSFIRKARIGGVILFSHNFENAGQVAELTNQIQENRGDLPLFVSVDQEGGKVQRFKKGFTKIPDAQTIGATGSPKLAFDIASVIAKELKAVGINLNFCPIADIATNSKNPVIGNRSFGSTSEVVSRMITAVVRGHLLHGVQPCVKHFPGHGDTSTDSHFALPRVDTPLDVLNEREFKPFIKAFKAKCAMVMTAHILNSKLDAQYPATLSKYILKEILRKQLRYEKLIISDDLEMKAITDHYGAEEAPRLALEAGCDMLIYRTEATARYAYDALTRALEAKELSPDVILRAARRIRSLKEQNFSDYQPAIVSDVGQEIGTSANLGIVQKFEAFSASNSGRR